MLNKRVMIRDWNQSTANKCTWSEVGVAEDPAGDGAPPPLVMVVISQRRRMEKVLTLSNWSVE
jgi:hypothetical protein